MPSAFPVTQLMLVDSNGILVADFGAPQIEDRSAWLLIRSKPVKDDSATLHAPYIEFCGRDMNWYGYANGFELDRSRLLLRMDEAWPEYLPYDGVAEVDFAIDGMEFRELMDALETMFGRIPHLAVEAVL